MKIAEAFGLDKTETFEDEYSGVRFSWTATTAGWTREMYYAFTSFERDPLKLPEFLAGRIISWTVFLKTEGDFPPTAENLAKCPEPFLTLLANRLSEVITGKKTKAESLQNGSVAEASTAVQ